MDRMPTLRQQKVAQLIAENDGKIKSKQDLLLKAGYSESIAKSPNKVFKASGLEKLRKEGKKQGITEEFCIKKLKGAIQTKRPQIMLQALKLWLSIYAPESEASTITKSLTLNQTNIHNTETRISEKDKNDYAIYRVKEMIKNGTITIEELSH